MELLIQKLENAYVSAPNSYGAEATPSSYVDLRELWGCLQDYFNESLDDVDEHLNRLWMPLDQLIPGRPLASQLDSATMRRAILLLPTESRLALYACFQNTGYNQLAKLCPPGMTLIDLHSFYLSEAVTQLGAIVKTML